MFPIVDLSPKMGDTVSITQSNTEDIEMSFLLTYLVVSFITSVAVGHFIAAGGSGRED